MSKSVFLPPSQTRLVTICAHVDHGKTTLADNLIERNGIISERLAGTIRYLDSMEEEQRRGITIRASAIGLKHTYVPPSAKKQAEPIDMIVHLLDSPGTQEERYKSRTFFVFPSHVFIFVGEIHTFFILFCCL